VTTETTANEVLDGWIGREIDGRYRVRELLGEGGMGAVFVAEHLTLHKEVALKIVHPDQLGSQAAVARFAREAMVTSRIDHPNVISAMDYGTLPDGSAYLAMQLVRGQTLTEVLDQERSLPWPRACEIAAQIADGLSAAREHGIVHRDMKPDNILIQRRPDGGELVKVLDFGVARFTRESMAPPDTDAARPMTRAGTVIGTPGYMAPEQIVGKPADHRSDLYALGVILWECVVGKKLWELYDLQELAQAQLTVTPLSLHAATGDLTIPEVLDKLVAALLARQADDRPQDVNAVRDVLRDALRSVPAPPRRHSQDLLQAMEAKGEEAAARTTGERPVPSPSPTPRGPNTKRVTGASTPLSTESYRPSWLPAKKSRFIFGVLAAVVVVVGLVMTGQLEVRPRGEVLRFTDRIAPAVLPLVDPMAAAAQVEPAPAPLPAPATELPAALSPAFATLAGAGSRTERVAAAETILTHVPAEDVPAYARGMARLQTAESCTDKLDRLQELRRIGDPRVLPGLHELSMRKRAGCGKRGKQDCLACLRSELAGTIGELEAKSVEAAAPTP
jgi:serine/threonine protein kinase